MRYSPASQISKQNVGDLEGAWTYARQTVAGMALTFRLTPPDPLLFSSFWTGFGWLDVRPASAFLVGLVLVLAALVVRTLWLLPGRDPGPRPLRLGILASGLVASLWLYAFVLFGARISVHGRYLLGWWLEHIDDILSDLDQALRKS